MRSITAIKIVTLVFLLISAGCRTSEKEGNGVATPEVISADLISVSRSQFEKNNMRLDSSVMVRPFQSIRATGIIDVPPENRVSVSPIIGGYVTYNPLLVGSKVDKGDLLLQLENAEFVELQQEFLTVKEELKYLEEEYLRHRELLKEKITSKKNFLRAESSFLSAKAQFHGIKKQLELLNINTNQVQPETISSTVNIYAPIAGSITMINSTKGKYLQPSETAMEIVNNEHLHLELNIFERDILKVKKGQEIHFRVPETTSETYVAEVFLKSNALSDNRTIRIHGHIPDSLRNSLVVGMYVEANILTGENEAGKRPAVPESAIVELEDRNFILILVEQRQDELLFRKTEVFPGESRFGTTELKEFPADSVFTVLSMGAFDLIR